MAHILDQMTSREFEDLLKKTDLAIVPVGVIEAHGTHAPVGTDNYIAEEVAKRLATKTGALMLPTIKYGNNTTEYDATMYPGSISISTDTMGAFYTELGKELARWGIKRIIFVNGHYCNTPSLDIAAFKIWKETGTAVGIHEWWVVAKEEVAKASPDGAHADECETGMLMATDGARYIRMNEAEIHHITYEKSENEARRFGMRFTANLRAKSYGNPTLARKDVGDRIMEVAAERGIALSEALKKHVKSKGRSQRKRRN